MSRPASCLNCLQPLAGRWCSSCGQDGDRSLRPLPQLVRDGLGELLNVDGRLRRTLRALVFRPGRLTQEYVAGRFVNQTPPLRLYLAASAIYFLAVPRLHVGRVPLPGTDPDGYFEFGPLGWDSQLLLLVLAPLSALALAVLLWDRRPTFEALFVFCVHYTVVFLATIAVLALCASVSTRTEAHTLTIVLLSLAAVAPLPWFARALYVAFGVRGVRLIGTTLLWLVVHVGLGQILDNTLRLGTPFR